MTIKTNVMNLTASPRMKALAVGALILAMIAASLLAPSQARASAFPGANGKIVFISNRTTGVNNPEGDLEIFSMNPDGTGLKQLTKNNTDDTAPSYSSDGKKIVFQSLRTGNFDVFSMNADGTGQTNLTKVPASDVRPSFSPDGKKILFDSNRDASRSFDVFVMNADGTQQKALTTDPAEDANATFSPSGNKIAFVSRRGDPQGFADSDIFTMNPDGTQQTRLTDNSFEDEDPSFSPDGSKITFATNRSGGGDSNDFDIFVMGSDGSNPTNFTASRAKDNNPAFSPDGKKIAFVSTRDGGDQDIFVMDASSGANQTNITPNVNFDVTPDWQPTAATFTVTTATDLGDGICDTQCTLREAINTSNNTSGPGANTIKFNIPGGGVQTISPISVLPPITRSVVIDGYTQPGSSPNTLTTGDNAVLQIELNGTNLSSGFAPGLRIVNASNSVIRGLVINRFGGDGLEISGDSSNNWIEGNFIGTDPTGTIDRGNGVDGLGIFDGPSGNVVGGSTPATRNVISGNDGDGIFVSNANGNQIQGNYVGTDKGGTKDLGNQGIGGVFLAGSDGNTVGGTTAGARNVVSGNDGDGIDLDGRSNENEVLGNRIGTTANGTGALGNAFDGIFVFGSNNLIGDGTSGGGNTIAFNANDGIDIAGSESTGNAISRNSIFSNSGLGLDLRGGFEDAAGGTANDPGDIDSGPNGLQNKPVLTSAKKSSINTTITGKLDSTPGKTFKIEFFSNSSGDEGKKFLGQKSVTTDGSGSTGTFTFAPATAVAAGQTVTATATDTAGNTSEFSAPRTVALSTGRDLSPETTKLSGPSGITNSLAAHFRFESPDAEATFECSLDGGAFYACSSPENVNSLSEGRHAFAVRALDEEGNADPTPATWIWAVKRNK